MLPLPLRISRALSIIRWVTIIIAHGIAGFKASGGWCRAWHGWFYIQYRNGNNPASAKADIDLNISAMAIYKLRVKEYPMTLRYQFTIPFAGVLFSPLLRASRITRSST